MTIAYALGVDVHGRFPAVDAVVCEQRRFEAGVVQHERAHNAGWRCVRGSAGTGHAAQYDDECAARAHSPPSVIAPLLAVDTRRVYFASTPRV